jgi:chromosome segregation ATPase
MFSLLEADEGFQTNSRLISRLLSRRSNRPTRLMRPKRKSSQKWNANWSRQRSVPFIESLEYFDQVTQIDYADADAALQRERAVLSQFDEEVKALDVTIKRIQDVLTDLDVEIKKTEHDITTATKDRQTSQAHVVQLEKQNPWIPDERGYVQDLHWWLAVTRAKQTIWQGWRDVRF